MGGLPFGIEIAAAWVAVLKPEEIAAEIEQSLDMLATDAANVPERHQSLRRLFDASRECLSGEEQQALQTLAAFEDGFDREAARKSAKEGQVERASEPYALASRYPFAANSRWLEGVIGQQIAAAAASLPPEVAQAADERSLARDLGLSQAELMKGRAS